jgi:hypothetical protein
MLRAGLAKSEITPGGSVPLAGYFTLRGRESRAVRDSLFARALALEEDKHRVVLIVLDILMVTEPMARQIRANLHDLDAHVMVCATHTHSGPGGFWDGLVPKLALGRFVPGMLEFLCARAEQAARLAVADLSDARYSVYSARLPELAKNRRDIDGPLDDELLVFRLNRAKAGKGNALIVNFPGHPVIVAERDFNKVSADFPGEVVRRLEERVEFAAFVNGALGGVDVRFPDEPISVEENLDLQAGPIAEAAQAALRVALKTKAGLKSASREIASPACSDARAVFEDQRLAALLARPLERALSWAFNRSRQSVWRVQGVALGDLLLIGAPADLGVGIALELKQYARDKGFGCPVVISQCDGYLGYLHRRAEYAHLPPKGTRGMAIYENTMSIYGREMGERYLAEAKALVDELVS